VVEEAAGSSSLASLARRNDKDFGTVHYVNRPDFWNLDSAAAVA